MFFSWQPDDILMAAVAPVLPDHLEEILQDIVAKIVDAIQPEQIILFGSAARGEFGPDSDLDLLVVKDGVHRRKTAMLLYRTLGPMKVAKDIIVASNADLEKHRGNPATIYKPALEEGRVIYSA